MKGIYIYFLQFTAFANETVSFNCFSNRVSAPGTLVDPNLSSSLVLSEVRKRNRKLFKNLSILNNFLKNGHIALEIQSQLHCDRRRGTRDSREKYNTIVVI